MEKWFHNIARRLDTSFCRLPLCNHHRHRCDDRDHINHHCLRKLHPSSMPSPLILDKFATNLRCRPLRRSFRAGSSPSDEQPVVRAGFISTAFAGHAGDEEMQNHNCGGLRSKQSSNLCVVAACLGKSSPSGKTETRKQYYSRIKELQM